MAHALISFLLKESPWLGLREPFPSQKDGFRNMLKKNEMKSKKRLSICPATEKSSSKPMKCGLSLVTRKMMLWIWLAVERRTKLIVGYHVGKRDNAGAAALWDSLSEDCKKNGIFFTDGLAACFERGFQLKGIELSAKEAEKQVISKGSI